MENKDFIEIYDENSNVKKMEIVMMFEKNDNSDYQYIIYKELENNILFGGKIKKQEDTILETNLSDTEKLFLQQNLDLAIKQEINKKN